MDVNQTRTQADWFNITTIDSQSSAFSYVKSFYVSNLQRFLKPINSAALPRTSIFGIKAPLCPRVITTNLFNQSSNQPIILSAFPNPVNNYLTVQLHQVIEGDLNFSIYDASGKIVKIQLQKEAQIGVNKYYIPMEDLSTGVYLLKINTGDYSQTLQFIKN
jgi:hypothetical protein